MPGEPAFLLAQSIANLSKVISSTKGAFDRIATRSEEIDLAADLREGLEQAVTSSTISNVLRKVLDKNLGGKATKDIAENLAKASKYRQQYLSSRSEEAAAGKNEKSVFSQLMAAVPGSKQWTTLNQKHSDALNRLTVAMNETVKNQARMRTALARGRAVALSPQSALGASEGLSGVLAKGSIIAAVFTEVIGLAANAVRAFQFALRDGSSVIQQYSMYGVGAMHAASIEYIGDLQRLHYISSKLSDDMIRFSIESTKSKNKWKDFDVLFEKLRLSADTAWSRLSGWAGDIASSGAKQISKMLISLRDSTKGKIDPFSFMIHQLLKDFKGLDESADALTKAMIAARKAALEHPGAPIPAGLNPIEEAIRKEIMFPPKPFVPPLMPEGGKPAPGGPGGPGGEEPLVPGAPVPPAAPGKPAPPGIPHPGGFPVPPPAAPPPPPLTLTPTPTPIMGPEIERLVQNIKNIDADPSEVEMIMDGPRPQRSQAQQRRAADIAMNDVKRFMPRDSKDEKMAERSSMTDTRESSRKEIAESSSLAQNFENIDRQRRLSEGLSTPFGIDVNGWNLPFPKPNRIIFS
jgi:hypothetical protein